MRTAEKTSLLSPADPDPVELVNWDSDYPVLLVCEHAGNAVPVALDTLGISDQTLHSHRGWDINAEKVARTIAEILRAPLVVQRYSRLVIDSNRPPNAKGSIPEISDNALIPGNQNLLQSDRSARIAEIFEPFNQAVISGFSAHPRRAAFSVHSFTPNLGGQYRPWHCGFLSRKSPGAARRLMNAVASENPNLSLTLNQPYQIDDDSDWFIPIHAEKRELPNCLIEIRNDQIGSPEEIFNWAVPISRGIREILGELS